MGVLRPFRAVRFRPGTAAAAALCPPYDVISKDLARRLRRKPLNSIHVELPAGGDGRYTRAARLFRSWLERGVLVRDPSPSYYVLEQTARYGGRAVRRVGLFADLSLARGGREVTPHERTFSKPRQDRMRLIKAVGANTSPIFLLAADSSGRLRAALSRVTRSRPVLTGADPSGLRLRLWRVEPSALPGLPARLLIADGHHRFRTAVEHARAARKDTGCLVYVCADEAPGLLLATHRVASPEAPVMERLGALCRLTRGRDSRPPLFLGVRTAAGRWDARPRKAFKGLPVEWLADELRLPPDTTGMRYTHDAKEAAALARRDRGAALLLPDPTVAQVRDGVRRRGLLPQKSTYFYPKVPTGLVFRELPI